MSAGRSPDVRPASTRAQVPAGRRREVDFVSFHLQTIFRPDNIKTVRAKGGVMVENTASASLRYRWLLWWLIDPTELSHQVDEYGRLNIFKSIRGQAALCLLLSVSLTIVFVLFRMVDSSAYVDAVILAVLAIFVYLGHRWAMIGAMILWTLEKGFLLAGSFESHSTTITGHPIVQIVWWALYMHAFYFALRVEQKRRTAVPADEQLPS